MELSPQDKEKARRIREDYEKRKVELQRGADAEGQRLEEAARRIRASQPTQAEIDEAYRQQQVAADSIRKQHEKTLDRLNRR